MSFVAAIHLPRQAFYFFNGTLLVSQVMPYSRCLHGFYKTCFSETHVTLIQIKELQEIVQSTGGQRLKWSISGVFFTYLSTAKQER